MTFYFTLQFALSLDSETARAMHDEELSDEAFKDAGFCSMRITQTQRAPKDGTRSFTPSEDAVELTMTK